MAYAGLKEPAARLRVAEALQIGARSVDRITTNERELRVPEAKALAALTETPLDFLLNGWDADSVIANENRATLLQVREQLAALRDQIEKLSLDVETRDLEVQRRLSEIAQPNPPQTQDPQQP